MSLTGEIVTELEQGTATSWIVATLLAGSVAVGLWIAWRTAGEVSGGAT